MKDRILAAVLLAAVVAVAGCASTTTGTDAPAADAGADAGGEQPVVEQNIVEFTPDGFAPAVLTVKQGERVTFINHASGKQTWPASAVHPTHTVYPGSSIEKCGTTEQAIIFDACKALNQDEQWSFVFNEKGSWKYHDHLNTQFTGTIVVE